MSFGKLHHWAMMGAMILMGGGAALAAYGSSTSFLHIALGYVKHIFVGGYEAIGPGLKAIGVAAGNLLSTFGIDPGSLTTIDPAMMKSAGTGYMSHGAAAPVTTSALDTLELADKFAAACEPGMALAPAPDHAAHMAAQICAPSPMAG